MLKKSAAAGFCVLLLAALPVLGAERAVEGTVFYKGGEPAANAAVELEDRSSLQVVSRRTDQEGRFRFYGLSPDKDYDVRATKNGRWSKSHTLSRFSSRAVEKVTLYLLPGPGSK